MTETKTFQLIDYLTCRVTLNVLGFTDDEIRKAIKDLDLPESSIVEEKSFKEEPKWIKTKEYVRKGIHYYKEYKGQYYKDCSCMGVVYKVTKQYQGLIHGKIIHKMLENKYEWFNSFYKEVEEDIKFCINIKSTLEDIPHEYKDLTVNQLYLLIQNTKKTTKKSLWSLYEMYNEKYELYLDTEFGSLYVPIQAILENNFDMIEERMISYFKSYFNITKVPNERYLNAIKPLTSKEANKLKSYLTSN
jgi:hypothetical protein